MPETAKSLKAPWDPHWWTKLGGGRRAGFGRQTRVCLSRVDTQRNAEQSNKERQSKAEQRNTKQEAACCFAEIYATPRSALPSVGVAGAV